MRYGAQARFDNYRITADELEQPMRQAVSEFYSTGCDVISSAAGMAPGASSCRVWPAGPTRHRVHI